MDYFKPKRKHRRSTVLAPQGHSEPIFRIFSIFPNYFSTKIFVLGSIFSLGSKFSSGVPPPKKKHYKHFKLFRFVSYKNANKSQTCYFNRIGIKHCYGRLFFKCYNLGGFFNVILNQLWVTSTHLIEPPMILWNIFLRNGMQWGILEAIFIFYIHEFTIWCIVVSMGISSIS